MDVVQLTIPMWSMHVWIALFGIWFSLSIIKMVLQIIAIQFRRPT